LSRRKKKKQSLCSRTDVVAPFVPLGRWPRSTLLRGSIYLSCEAATAMSSRRPIGCRLNSSIEQYVRSKLDGASIIMESEGVVGCGRTLTPVARAPGRPCRSIDASVSCHSLDRAQQSPGHRSRERSLSRWCGRCGAVSVPIHPCTCTAPTVELKHAASVRWRLGAGAHLVVAVQIGQSGPVRAWFR